MVTTLHVGSISPHKRMASVKMKFHAISSQRPSDDPGRLSENTSLSFRTERSGERNLVNSGVLRSTRFQTPPSPPVLGERGVAEPNFPHFEKPFPALGSLDILPILKGPRLPSFFMSTLSTPVSPLGKVSLKRAYIASFFL